MGWSDEDDVEEKTQRKKPEVVLSIQGKSTNVSVDTLKGGAAAGCEEQALSNSSIRRRAWINSTYRSLQSTDDVCAWHTRPLQGTQPAPVAC